MFKVSKIQRKGWQKKYPSDWKETVKSDKAALGGRCARCGLPDLPGNPLQRDHIIPLTRGGSNSLMNQRLLHKFACHPARHRKKL